MRHLLLILLLGILGSGFAFSAPASLPQTDVFIGGQDGYAAYRIPALGVAADGTLLAFAEARKTNLGDPGAKETLSTSSPSVAPMAAAPGRRCR
jgi:sialidase-1